MQELQVTVPAPKHDVQAGEVLDTVTHGVESNNATPQISSDTTPLDVTSVVISLDRNSNRTFDLGVWKDF